MLLDPLALLTGATSAATFTGGAAQNFGRTADGRYVGSTIGTLDEPQFLDITNRLNFNGVSTYTIRSRQQKNVAAINGVPQKDDELAVSVQILLPHRSFVAANVVDHYLRILTLVNNASVLQQVLLGQR